MNFLFLGIVFVVRFSFRNLWDKYEEDVQLSLGGEVSMGPPRIV